MVQHPNEQLAQDYFKVAAQVTVDNSAYRRARDAIRDSSVEIAEFYRKQGDLSELRVTGIGPHTRGILELILAHGVEEAREIVRAKKEARGWGKIHRRPYGDTGMDDTDPSWENGIRVLERE